MKLNNAFKKSQLACYFGLMTSIAICLFSAIALGINYFVTQFPGNNYFPPGTIVMAAILCLILLGSYLLFRKESVYFQIAKEVLYYFLVISVLALATNAAQLTPFAPIDRTLINIDKNLNIHLEQILAWRLNMPWLTKILSFSYDSLPAQMTFVPLIFIFVRKTIYLREYYSLLLLTTFIGFIFYYFWPTLGPASSMVSPYFSNNQFATGIKFKEIHDHIPPSTIEGGMIAMPSFHMIWGLLCLNLSRSWPLLFVLLLPLNLLLIAACVMLGWHYFIDLVGSVVLFAFAYFVYWRLIIRERDYEYMDTADKPRYVGI